MNESDFESCEVMVSKASLMGMPKEILGMILDLVFVDTAFGSRRSDSTSLPVAPIIPILLTYRKLNNECKQSISKNVTFIINNDEVFIRRRRFPVSFESMRYVQTSPFFRLDENLAALLNSMTCLETYTMGGDHSIHLSAVMTEVQSGYDHQVDQRILTLKNGDTYDLDAGFRTFMNTIATEQIWRTELFMESRDKTSKVRFRSNHANLDTPWSFLRLWKYLTLPRRYQVVVAGVQLDFIGIRWISIDGCDTQMAVDHQWVRFLTR